MVDKRSFVKAVTNESVICPFGNVTRKFTLTVPTGTSGARGTEDDEDTACAAVEDEFESTWLPVGSVLEDVENSGVTLALLD